MTIAQIKYVRGLLARAGMMDIKDQVVMQYTNNRTTHLSDMNYQETQELIGALSGENSRAKQVRKIMSMAHEMQWELEGGKVDIARINAWCVKYSHQHKALNELTEQELPAVVTTFTKVYQSFLKGL